MVPPLLSSLSLLLTSLFSSPLLHHLLKQLLILALGLLLIAATIAVRVFLLLPQVRSRLHLKVETARKRKAGQTCKTALFLGSGGHTTELLLLLSHLDPQRYTPRIYILSSNDDFSHRKALELERSWGRSDRSDESSQEYSIVTIPRAREVHQPWLTTPLSFLRSLAAAWACTSPRTVRVQGGATEEAFADLLLMNGPGTCVTLLLATYLHQILSPGSFFSSFLSLRPRPRSIYIESFARVKTLSLTGKIAQWAVDTFVKQWGDQQDGGTAGVDGDGLNQSLSTGWLV